MHTQAKLIDLRAAWRDANRELTLARRAQKNGQPVADEDVGELEQIVASIGRDLEATAAAVQRDTVPQIPEDVAALSDAMLADVIATKRAAIAEVRAALKPLLAERDRRQLVVSGRKKLERLTPEERAALSGAQGIAPEGIASGEQLGNL